MVLEKGREMRVERKAGLAAWARERRAMKERATDAIVIDLFPVSEDRKLSDCSRRRKTNEKELV